MTWFETHYRYLEDALQNSNITGVFGNAITIGALSLILFSWALIAAARLRYGVSNFCSALSDSTAAFSATPRAPTKFSASFEVISARFQDARIVGPAWREWSATLITPTTDTAPIRSTVRPDAYFSLDLLRACGINPRLHAAMPNLLVGLGLLLTFLGLSLALSAAGSIADGTEQLARRQGLKDLLDAASAKFVTSLVGLLCSLAYTGFRGDQLVRAERALDSFLAALEERIPLATSAGLQAEANALLEKSLLVQTQFATEVAVNIGSRLDNALDTRLGEHIGPLREAIERLSEGIGTKSEDTLKTLLDQFQNMLQGSAQHHMEKVAEALAQTSGAMSTIREGLSDAAAKMADAAEKMSEQMGRSAEDAMARITLQMEGLVEQLRKLAEDSRSAGNQAMDQAASRVAEAGETFSRAAKDISASLQDAVSALTGRIGDETEAAARRMTEEMGRATDALRALAEQNRAAGDEASKELAERMSRAAEAFERSAEQVSEALKSGAGDAASKFIDAVVELRSQFGRLTETLSGNLGEAGEHFLQHGKDSATAIVDAAVAAADAIRSGARDGGDALRVGGGEASREIQAAASDLARPAADLAQRISALQNEAMQLNRTVENMRQAAIESTAPLRAASIDLAKAGASAERTTADLSKIVQRIVPFVETLDGAMVQMKDVETRLGSLVGGLDKALGGFTGLDNSLSEVFNNLRIGLTGFAQQVTKFVGDTNKDMAQAVSALSGAIQDLEEVLAERNSRKTTGGN